MTKENESVKKIEVGKDYVNVHDNSVIVIDRTGGLTNRGFEGREYKDYLSCSTYSNWREATKEEVIKAFKRHLVCRYGKGWETMKIKESHPDSSSDINDGSWHVGISKLADGWNVWNKHGLLYRNGIWVERLKETTKSTNWSFSPEDIKEIKASEKADNRYVLKRDVLTILSVESKLNPDKKLSEYLEQFKLILEVL